MPQQKEIISSKRPISFTGLVSYCQGPRGKRRITINLKAGRIFFPTDPAMNPDQIQNSSVDLVLAHMLLKIGQCDWIASYVGVVGNNNMFWSRSPSLSGYVGGRGLQRKQTVHSHSKDFDKSGPQDPRAACMISSTHMVSALSLSI